MHGDLDAVREIFDFYDGDRNGSIDRAEFGRLCKALDSAFSEEEIDMGLEAVDANGNGVIEWSEFVVWWRDRE